MEPHCIGKKQNFLIQKETNTKTRLVNGKPGVCSIYFPGIGVMFTQIASFALLGLFSGLGGHGQPLQGTEVAWQTAKVFDVPTQTDPVITEIINDYLDRLVSLGYDRDRQGIWLQSEWAFLADHRGNNPFPAASLTKIATSLAALDKWGLDHQFVTRFYADGPIQNGVLQGNLIIEGGDDPLFVWEEAIAVGNGLNQLGIQEITGDLIIVGNFAMNFKTAPGIAGALFKQAVNESQWSGVIETAFAALPPGTPRPQVKILGQITPQATLPPMAQPILERRSLSVGALVKQMNIYSNNEMAEMLANAAGGTPVVMQTALRLAQIPASEIQLQNGSGLGVDNRLSAVAVTRLYQALQAQLQPQGLNLDDLFPVMGRDRRGTLEWRSMPKGLTVKTGTLNEVSALAGVIPTQERGTVWFSIINGGRNFDRLRAEQDRMLQRIAQHWQISPQALEPGPNDAIQLGDPQRNQFLAP
jgi:D-alanyl-D-alanine carboxypeptidase/D-alanyl-D-alanine-endopeptidase (penicillin-binding protein 4)